MKLKYKFIVREIDGTHVAVAVGKDNENFNGMIKLNKSGAVIFKLLNESHVSIADIVKALTSVYDISEEKAEQTAKNFIEQFKKYELIVE